MTELLELELHNFFSIGSRTIRLANQGRVLVTGRNGASKTATLIEGPYYALFGRSFEYGEKPGDAVVNRFNKKSFFTRIDFQVSSGTVYRILRTKGVKEASGVKVNRDGVHLLQQSGDLWEDISSSKAVDTQETINGLLGMTPLTFCNTTSFSSDVLRLPDFPEAEKKRIISELLQVSGCDVALKSTLAVIADITQEITLKNSLAKVTANSIDETGRTIASLKESASSWKADLEKRKEEASRRKAMLEAELKEKQNGKERAEHSLGLSTTKFTAIKELLKKLRDRSAKADSLLQRSHAEKPVATESPRLKRELASLESGVCPSCNRLLSEGVSKHDHEESLKEAKTKLEAALKEEKSDYDAWNSLHQQILAKKAQISNQIEAAEIDQDSAEAEITRFQKSKQAFETSAASLLGQLERFEEETIEETVNPYLKHIEEANENLAAYEKSLADCKEQLEALQVRLANEKLFQELFGNKGCRVDMLNESLPFLNEKCLLVAEKLKTDIEVRFNIRAEDESFANTLEICVENPCGAGSYHGNSAGERRLADLIVLFSLMSLATASNGAIGQVFFDETFEKLFPDVKNNVLEAMAAISEQRNSVFIISHAAEGLNLDLIDQIWNISNGEIEVTQLRKT